VCAGNREQPPECHVRFSADVNALFVFLSGMLCDVLVDEIEKATTGFFTAV
jgi:hypothetical protein